MAFKTITIKGDPVIGERKASAAITPGFLLELVSTDKVQKHATPGGSAYAMFALEDENQGKEIEDAYTTDNVCLFGIFRRGDEVNALLANGEEAVVGSKLESNGDGYLRVVAADSSLVDIGIQSIVTISLVNLDMSGSSGVDPASQRIRCMVI